jgi:transcriptional regulator with XRE-family HTH domain
MAYPAYLRERARELRTTKGLSLNEIAERLALPKTTVYYWIKGLPLGRKRRASPGRRKGNRAMCAKYKQLRDDAYARGLVEYDELVLVPTFRDFVVLYIAEGYKRDRNVVSISNSDPLIVAMATAWLRRLSQRQPVVRVQYHADQNHTDLVEFWSATAGVPPEAVRLQPKSNSGSLGGRTWRCVYGVAAVDVYDTLLRARIQAWIDRVKEGWGLDSAA